MNNLLPEIQEKCALFFNKISQQFEEKSSLNFIDVLSIIVQLKLYLMSQKIPWIDDIKFISEFLSNLKFSIDTAYIEEALIATGKNNYKDNPTIFFITDTQGDCQSIINNLIFAQIVDSNLDWVGKNVKLIHGGDIFDRYNEGIQSLELLLQLKEKAQKLGGEVICLLGNHEILLFKGMFHREEDFLLWAIFNGGYSVLQELSQIFNIPIPSPTELIVKTEQGGELNWDSFQQLLDIRDKFKVFFDPEESHYGKFLTDLKILHIEKIGDSNILFVHGGISPESAKEIIEVGIDKINAQVSKAFIEAKYNRWNLLENINKAGIVRGGKADMGGFLWFDSYHELNEPVLKEVSEILKPLNISTIISGHSYENNLLQSRVSFKGVPLQVIRGDIGISRAYTTGYAFGYTLIQVKEKRIFGINPYGAVNIGTFI